VKIFDAKAFSATSISFDFEFQITGDKNIKIEFERLLKKGEEDKNFIFNQLNQFKEDSGYYLMVHLNLIKKEK
jgi:hypothetical protein